MPTVLKSGSLNFLGPSGPVQACNGIALPLDFASSVNKVFLTQQKILYTVPGISSRSSRRKWFKKLEILPISSLYIYSLMLFVVDNMHYFQTDFSIHDINSRYKNHLATPSVRLAAVKKKFCLFCC